MTKQILSISLDPAAVEFWDAQLALSGQTRSGWLNLVLRTWARSGNEPRSFVTGPDWEDGIAVAPTIAAQKEAARRAPATSYPPLPVVRHRSYEKAVQAYKSAEAALRMAEADPAVPQARRIQLHNLAAAQQDAIADCTED